MTFKYSTNFLELFSKNTAQAWEVLQELFSCSTLRFRYPPICPHASRPSNILVIISILRVH